MKKAIIALAASSVFALSACGSSDTIVKSSSGNVTKEEFYDAMKERAGQGILKQLVIEKVFTKKYKVSEKDVEKEYEDAKKQYGDQFKELLKQSGMTEDSFKKQIRSSLALKKAVATSLTDKELKEHYKPEIKASHILVKDEATAKKVKDLLAQGQSFEELAKQYSEDKGSGEKGGDLDYFGPGQMVPEFEEAAYKLKKGETSEPVKSQYGYHIIKVTDIKELKSFEEEKAKIKDKLVEEKMQDSAFMNELVDKELKKANVKVEDKDLKDALKPAEQPAGQ
ncbi:peptidylprolyl isomerase PrsA [Ectobacillus antri]|jgi:foldase protein PrsA|uniref:Foldase protein PrsA n=1 Tax=Ectobacillus antri TaxID=2486280 RepID=A0ABT6H3V3_9BACI|nr:peptidylprolyl isomerase PrsA [Ectobacillus antri]MDG4656743.1 peptidylprolyl isomerase PrsA [Ectobacillus antri]MDG5753894.1 peptidylprolyl isomerase PrsA [Ectobacillus antri]